MKIRNDTDSDACPFGIHIAAGETITLPDDTNPAVAAHFRCNFTEVKPVEEITGTVEIVAGPNWPADEPVPVVPRVTKKRGRKKATRRS